MRRPCDARVARLTTAGGIGKRVTTRLRERELAVDLTTRAFARITFDLYGHLSRTQIGACSRASTR
jgi:hypothetical protein